MKTTNRKRTKVISMILTFVMVFGIFACAPFTVSARTKSGDFFYEEVYEGMIEISGYEGKSSHLVIPETIDGKTVIGIYGIRFNEYIKKVTLPDTVIYLDYGAFENNPNLNEIKMSRNIVQIEASVFENTPLLKNQNYWDGGILYIDEYLITANSGLRDVKVKENTRLIADNAFQSVRTLRTIKFNDSLLYIGKRAFSYCNNLTSIELPDSIVYCGEGAFDICEKVEKIKISASMVYLSDYLFSSCKSITTIDIPENIEYIGKSVFKACYKLNTINLPDKYVEIDEDAFADTAYYYNEDNWAYNGLYLNDTIINVNEDISKLVIKEGTKYTADNLCNNMRYLKEVSIPSSLKIVGVDAFVRCPSLTSVTIPPTVEHIGWGAFGLDLSGDGYYRYANFEIIGIKGSVAEEYAKAFGHKFVDGSKATSIKLNKSSFKLGVGETYKLEKTVTPTLAESGCKWSSSDKSVATVNSKGEVVGKKSGTATITLKSANGKTATCKVTVYKAPSSIKLNKSTLTLGVDEWIDLSKTVGSGEFVNGPSLTWTSSDKNIVTAQRIAGAKCQVRAVGVGTATVTVKTYNGKTATCKVTVKKAPTAIKIDKEKINLGVGEEFVVTRSVVNDDEFMNPESGYWGSHNKKYAKVKKLDNHKAQITGVEVGNTVITATAYNGKTAKATVTVKKAPSKITLNKKSIKLGIGETHDLASTIAKDEFANNRNINWSSSNKKVVTVKRQPNGKATVTAVGTGTATITVKTYNGKTATCKVTVYKAPSNVYLDKTKINLGVGEKFELSRSVNSGAFVNGPSLTWTSSDKNIIKVKAVPGAKGEVTGVGVGTATVTVKTYNGKTTTCKVTVHKAPSAITLNKSSVSLKKGKTYELTSAIAKGEFLNNRNINWSSSNKKVVTVKRQSNGKATLTAVGKGTATITVKTYNGKTATCKVTVK